MSVKRKVIDYIVKGQKVFVGLEDSKKTWKVCVRSDKAIVHETHMPAQYKVLKKFFDNKFPSCEVHLVYEAGFKGFSLYFRLIDDGYACTVVPPHTVMQEKCSRVKNDRIDARLLAKNLEDGNCKSCYVPDSERLADRQVARTLSAVNKDIRRTKNRIRQFLNFHGIDPCVSVANWGKRLYRALHHLEVSNTRLRSTLDMHLGQLEFLWKQQYYLLKLLEELSKEERYAEFVRIAKTLPGVGKLTAIRLVLELGENLSRFKSGGEIASFVGLGGTEYSTGERVRRGGITKQGNAELRSWLIECAWRARAKDPALREFYSRIKSNTGKGNKAIVAVARKLITRLRSCIVSNTEYVLGVVA
jgi:transposase